MPFALELAAVGVVIGIAVGCTGIGGILLVPILAYGFGLGVAQSVAIALLSYLPSGVVAIWLYARYGSIDWRSGLPLCLAACPAALLGAYAASVAPRGVLEIMVALLLVLGGVSALFPMRMSSAASRTLRPPVIAGLGVVTGFISAMSGAGGALVLLPMLLLLDQAVLPSIGLGQLIQFPIAAVATAANLAAGSVDVTLGAELAVSLAAGIVIGTPIAHALPQVMLRRVLGVALLAVGLLLLGQVGWRQIAA
ncbi:MAG TPA: sulfite exporter TauE/SafE family protein [Candidatus Cybelea sp.]|nr:sulfite exporter TauE/SafE family protein [Candidatus Cybelea sp.]